jgi:hypothetical protein
MSAYVRDATKALADDLEARFHAAFFRQNERATADIVVGVVTLAVSLTGLFMAYVVTRAFGVGLSLVFAAILVVGWAVAIFAFARGWRTMFAVVSPAALAAYEATICSGCGATTAFAPAEVGRRCQHCSSTLLVPSAVAERLLGVARERSIEAGAARSGAWTDATRAGGRWVAPSVVAVVTVVVVAVFGVAFAGQPGGPRVDVAWVALAFASIFAAAIPVFVRATRGAANARRELDALIASAGQRPR